jgi:predicted nucleic acid-binding protein
LTRIVCDASVVFKWTVPGSSEADSAQALALLEGHLSGAHRIVVPALLFYEIGNILVCGTAKATLPVVEQELARVQELDLEVEPPSPAGNVLAARLAREAKLSFYDATYLALADSLRCDLVTADRALTRRAKRAGGIRLLGAEPSYR